MGDTSTHTFSAYVYNNTEGETGGAINDSVAELFYHGTVIPTTYSDLGGGWYKLTGQVTGENALRSYGLQVKSGKKVLLD